MHNAINITAAVDHQRTLSTFTYVTRQRYNTCAHTQQSIYAPIRSILYNALTLLLYATNSLP